MGMRNIAFGLSIGLAVLLLSSCNQATEPVFQGWVEAELIFVGPDENGRIETLTVREGSPVEKGMLLLTLDAAALMGYTGAVFGRLFGTLLGIAAAGAALLMWTGLPFVAGLRGFNRKDF